MLEHRARAVMMRKERIIALDRFQPPISSEPDNHDPGPPIFDIRHSIFLRNLNIGARRRLSTGHAVLFEPVFAACAG